MTKWNREQKLTPFWINLLLVVGLIGVIVCAGLLARVVRADSSYSSRGPDAVTVSSGTVTVSSGTVTVQDGPVQDGATDWIVVVEGEHHTVHAEESFTVNLTTVDLDSNPLNISFTTPDTAVWGHITATAGSSGNATVEIREAPTGGVVGGTDLVPLNRDRNSDVVSVMSATHEAVANELTQGASAGTGGTVLVQEEIGAGKDKIGGTSRGTQEFILRQNTTYCVRMTSVVNLVRATLQVDWYEHTNL